MKPKRFLLLITTATFLSLIYVYQQTEILRLAYLGEKKQVSYQDLLDKNKILRYNITIQASPVQIGDKIGGSKEFQMPDAYQLVRVVSPNRTLKAKPASAKKETALSRLFSIKREAEAKTINP